MDEEAKRDLFGIFASIGGVLIGLSIFIFFYNPSGWFLIWPFQLWCIITGILLISLYIIAWSKKIFVYNSTCNSVVSQVFSETVFKRIEKKHKPRAGLMAIGGIIIMIVGLVAYIVGQSFRVTLWDETRGLIGSSFVFGMGWAMLLLSATIARLDGKIQILEKRLEQERNG